jgi:hypothetical protein
MTGRASGFCTGYETPGYAKGFGGGMGRGSGFGRSRGRGMGYGRYRNFAWPFAGYYPGFPFTQSVSKDDEIKLLKSQAESLKRTQEDIEKRLEELEKK